VTSSLAATPEAMPQDDAIDVQRLRREFAAISAAEPQVFSAPGRVNLIGEHTDYNDGFVLPIALQQRTYVAGAVNASSCVRVRSLGWAETYEFDLTQPGPRRRGSWLDYVEGTARALIERGFALVGSDLVIDSNVPAGAGLSASAALELSVGMALATLGGSLDPDRVQLALAGQAAEHQSVGTLCGIMDQYIAALGRADAALLIDCRSLDTRVVPLRLGDASVLVCDTRVKHQLSSSGYNARRADCVSACQILAQSMPGISALRDVSGADFERFSETLPAIERRRARHVVTEIERTLEAARALAEGDLRETQPETAAKLRDLIGKTRELYDEPMREGLELAATDPLLFTHYWTNKDRMQEFFSVWAKRGATLDLASFRAVPAPQTGHTQRGNLAVHPRHRRCGLCEK